MPRAPGPGGRSRRNLVILVKNQPILNVIAPIRPLLVSYCKIRQDYALLGSKGVEAGLQVFKILAKPACRAHACHV
jgi:hypothetical protein